MALEKITRITGRAVGVPGNDIDTDRIIPARYLKCVTFDDLAEGLFADARRAEAEAGRVHPLDDPRFAGAVMLVSGANFGCGSSREHAPQAIRRAGFKAVVAENFAEIFFGNATQLGLPCVSASREDLQRLTAAIREDPGAELILDLEALTLSGAGLAVPVALRDSARDALTNGRWDTLGELLEGEKEVTAVAAHLPYLSTSRKN